ncbi:hypothetical protein M9Y10_016988 [Tritrichomonas musculus]|uniref:DDE-1 domain-containing protein n=1 Tax=Tritrichomonas musculus TaxID=1915356 RepID=A0ABR2HXS3_9EUKA
MLYNSCLNAIVIQLCKHDDYGVCNTLETELCTPQKVEINRLIAGTPENIKMLIDVFSPIITQYKPPLIFSSDETMLQLNLKRKVFKKSSKQKLVIPDNLNLPHITATCCCNIIGEKMLLFITLPSLVKLPQDLIDISENGKAFFFKQ